MTDTEYTVAITDGLNAIRRNFGTQDYFYVNNAMNYLISNFKYPKSVLEDEDEELVTYRKALEFIVLNFGDYEKDLEREGEWI